MVAAVTSNGSARNLHSMEGKVAFITGGASGIGLSTARECARRGASIAIVDLRKEAAQKAADELNREYAVPTLALGCNVAVQSEVQAAVDQCMSELGGLHMALNAAGMPSKGVDFADYPVDEFRRVIDVHLIGCFLCCRAEITAMIKSGSGSIVNISSLAGQVALGNQAAYIAAKHGVSGLTKAAAVEYAAKGVRCNAVAPGFIETPLFSQMAIETGRDPASAAKDLGNATPIGRTAHPDEVGRVIAFLLSDEASYVTGGFYPVDGAYLCAGRA